MTVVAVAGDVDLESLASVYASVFGEPPWSEPDASALLGRLTTHRERAGFRLVEARREGVLVGFAYGYTGERGQPWTEHVAGLVGQQQATALLGGHFELVELAVDPGARGDGLGRRLLDAVLSGRTEPCVLLQTIDSNTPAMRLYERAGFTRVVTDGAWVILTKVLR